MHGGVSHVDTWDPKPQLAKYSGKTLPPDFVKGLKTSRIDFTKALARGSSWEFRPRGQSGVEVSDLFPHMASHADELAFVRSCTSDAFDHAPAMYLTATGSQFPGKPCLGSWVVYGLGSENRDLPAFVGYESERINGVYLNSCEGRPCDEYADKGQENGSRHEPFLVLFDGLNRHGRCSFC